jgi:hypothetical protein
MKSSRIVGIVGLASAILVASAAVGGRTLAAGTQAATVDARSFATAPHAGTMSDPWPSSAITRAVNSLPQSGGTVIVDDGIWLFDSDQLVSRGNFVLQGSSLNAQLIFTAGTLIIGGHFRRRDLDPDGGCVARLRRHRRSRSVVAM